MDDEEDESDGDGSGVKKLQFDIADNPIDIEIRIDPEFKAIKYELTSDNAIDPFDAAYCLWLIINQVCEQFGISTQEFLGNYAKDIVADGNETRH